MSISSALPDGGAAVLRDGADWRRAGWKDGGVPAADGMKWQQNSAGRGQPKRDAGP
jgi:hypothetical protein